MEMYQHLVVLAAGIAFFMYGMLLASDNLQIIAADRVRILMSKLAQHQFMAILSGVALTVLLQSSSAVTALIHSSAVTIGLAMTLATNGVITLYDSMFWVYGANLGTTATALLASMGGNYVGRQVAWAHLFYKLGSCIIFLFVTAPFA